MNLKWTARRRKEMRDSKIKRERHRERKTIKQRGKRKKTNFNWKMFESGKLRVVASERAGLLATQRRLFIAVGMGQRRTRRRRRRRQTQWGGKIPRSIRYDFKSMFAKVHEIFSKQIKECHDFFELHQTRRQIVGVVSLSLSLSRSFFFCIALLDYLFRISLSHSGYFSTYFISLFHSNSVFFCAS